jgi:UDP-GlcNAc:undecaprenyl-phosphate/decaprenyl-phosphate GlcNAc-1-phosphate transferase
VSMEKELVTSTLLLAALVVSAVLVPLTRRLARRVGVMDAPGERKIHDTPMPRLGGAAVFVSFTALVVVGYLLIPSLSGSTWLRSRMPASLRMLGEAYRVEAKLVAMLIGGAVAFGVGLLDDILGRRFPVWLKLTGQVVAALILIAGGVRVSFLPFEWMNFAVTLLWIVGITNAFNLLDNMDGLSAGVAFVASGVLLINAWALGEFFISLLLAAFMGALLGFLFFNFHPASIFLGDCGSLFIGFVMASLTLLERYVSHASSTLFPILMPVVVLAVPLLDTATVIVIRLREGRPIYVGDNRHLSHRLLALGFSTRAAVLFIYLVTFTLGLGAVSLADASLQQSVLLLLQSVCFVVLILVLLFHERQAGQEPA